MLTKPLSLLLIVAIFSLGADLAFAQDRFADSEAQRVATVKSEILKLGRDETPESSSSSAIRQRSKDMSAKPMLTPLPLLI